MQMDVWWSRKTNIYISGQLPPTAGLLLHYFRLLVRERGHEKKAKYLCECGR